MPVPSVVNEKDKVHSESSDVQAQLLAVLSIISLFGLHASINHSDFLQKCAHIPDGNYPISPCSHHYLACTGGRGIIRVCPSGLVYNPVRNRCENKADVATCGISTTTTTTPLSDITTSTTEQQTFDCTGLLPGDYPLRANSCLQQYFTCDANSVGVVRVCPNDLYFDSVNRVCNFFGNIASCSGATAPQTTASTTLGPTLPPVEFDCSQRSDGFYPNPARQCSSIYYACTAGEARRLFCGSGLAYDVVTRACQSPDNTFACTGRTSTVTSPPTTITTQRSPIDCVTLPNGLYPNPENMCSRIFFACSDGIADRFVCPGELYFDPDTESCQRFNDIFACTGVTTTTTTTTLTTTTTPQSDVGFDCSSLADGLYPNPEEICSTFYFICSGSVARRQNCPSGLYYDPEIQRCNSFGNIFVCTGTRPTSTTTTIGTTVTSSPGLDCSNLANGLYPNPRSQCSPIYFYCTNGFTYERRCLGDLFFNPELRICDHYSDIFECTGTRSTPTTTPTPTTPQSDVPFNCAYLPNGNYPNPSQECSNMFFTCSNGKATIRTCPEETFFDPELRLCLKYSDVPACSGSPRTTTTATTTTALSDVTTPFFQCGNMPNGNYPLGACENTYVSCVDGQAIRRQCPPPNLFYDYTINECDYMYRVPGCGGERTTTPLSDVTVSTTTSAPSFDCSRLADGKYPNPDNPCYSDFYYVCAGGRTSRMNCPAGLIYDPTVQECRFRRHAKPCKKSSLRSA
ncbi:hypothetical protein M513_06620 [Trichuris suis]|uniref:Chitin-binding type-2 domain-containing protein n=1 Tax=Trichuris suis TaxID=68888 RepID=A0A085M5C7_9BILA|nr:hypothetical protein M513_06620 [Trichuris suis]